MYKKFFNQNEVEKMKAQARSEKEAFIAKHEASGWTHVRVTSFFTGGALAEPQELVAEVLLAPGINPPEGVNPGETYVTHGDVKKLGAPEWENLSDLLDELDPNQFIELQTEL